MRQLSSARRIALAMSLGVVVLAISVQGNLAHAEDAAPSQPSKSEPKLADSGWAVSSDAVSSDVPKPANGNKKKKSSDSKKNSKNGDSRGEPRVAALPTAEAPLKWKRAGVAKGSSEPEAAKPAASDSKSEKPTDKAAPRSSDTPKASSGGKASAPEKSASNKPSGEEQATEKPSTETPRTEEIDENPVEAPDADTPEATGTPESEDSSKDSEGPELREPAPFPAVIEIDEEPRADTGDNLAAEDESEEEAVDDAEERASEEESKPQRRTPRRSHPIKTTPTPKPETRNLQPLSRYQRSLRNRLRSVLSFYYRRPLNSVDHDPWEVMHHMLPYGQHSRLLDGGPNGRPMTAVGYLCYNRPCQRKQMMTLTSDGVIETRVAVGMQGHKGQLLAMLAQCDISPDYPIRVEGEQRTIRDLIRSEQLSCYSGEELTFKLIGLMHYLDPNDTWVNDQGETWSFPRLINEERNQKIRGAACGGSHRLSGLSLAVEKRRRLGQPIDGEYREAERFVDQYVNYTYRWQNRDGSLSTEWFRGPGDEEDINRRARTTGHLLEWLLYTIPDEQLTEQRTVRAVTYLTNLLAQNTSNPWEIGPLSHALHALMLYDRRMYQPRDAELIAAAKKSGRPSRSPENLNYRNIDSRVVASLPSADDAEEARAKLANANSGLRGLFGNRRRNTHRSR